jgi:hypothetical protein
MQVLSSMSIVLRLAFLMGVLLASPVVAAAPSAEFDIPYQLRLSDNDSVLELSGSFSWALPQSFQAVLASAPNVRLIRLESPGGHVQPAIQIAMLIHERGLDTYVGRFCASACTIAFLGGRQRWLGPDARLGFHQASAPGLPSDLVNRYLRDAYESFRVPSAFVARVLNTPASDLWFPTRPELRAVHYTTGDAPVSVVVPHEEWPPRLRDFAGLILQAPDEAVVQFATAITDILARLQLENLEACWAFAHEGPDLPAAMLSTAAHDALTNAGTTLANSVKGSREPAQNAERQKKAVAALVAAIREDKATPAMQGLRQGAEHRSFCSSFRTLLEAALALPPTHRVNALRAILSGGSHST